MPDRFRFFRGNDNTNRAALALELYYNLPIDFTAVAHIMFDYLFPLFYIKISAECVTVRDVKRGIEVSEVPEIAIGSNSGKKIILAAGKEARKIAAAQSATLVNPFRHPRAPLDDVTIAEQVLKAFVRRVQGNMKRLQLPVGVVIHPLGSPEGGLTQVERQAFVELAWNLGASRVALWIGRVISDGEVRSGQAFRKSTERR
ncbi:MAG: rod shape-determining protein [Zoogloeaceae bacterium]|jgi:rod shape-determining protein MreB|nr:rod shape-determining protein [Zoogloeaceae bacterium]